MRVYTNIKKLYTLKGGSKIKEALRNVEVLDDAWLAVEDEKIVGYGEGDHPYNKAEIIDMKGRVIIPGLIDAHSHWIFAGDRSNEYADKIRGISYLDILKKGGGILNTVKSTRRASKQELFDSAKLSLDKALSRGVTCLEVKSGYGLDKETEIKQLEVMKELNEAQPIDLIGTYLGAHALPPEFSAKEDYLKYCEQEVFPLVKPLAEFCDIFLDEGVFDYQEASGYLKKAKEYGFKIKMHIDEITNLMGSELAAEYQAVSVEHCMVTTPDQIKLLASAQIPIVLLPMTSFNLNKAYAAARLMRDTGAIIALGSDYNPGSCPCDDYLLTMRVASRVYGLLPEEILTMSTINAAKALDRDKIIGSLEVGKRADFVVLDVADFNDVIARMDNEPVKEVYCKGRRVYSC